MPSSSDATAAHRPGSGPPVDVTLMTPDGVRLAATFRGATSDPGPGRIACVVAHGFTGSSRNPHVRRICEGLVEQGFSVLAPDLRGHGRSGGLGTAGADEIHDVAAAVAWLRDSGYPTVAVLGWSMGGSAVLRHAGLGGDADAVVAVSAPGTWFERGTRSMRLVHWMFEKRTGRTATRLLRRTRLSGDGWPEVPAAPAEVAGAIAPTPLLIVHGADDHYFPRAHVDALAAAAPTATVWFEAGMGHAEVATTPDLVRRIAGWLRTAVGAAAPVRDDAAGASVGDDAAGATVCDDGTRD